MNSRFAFDWTDERVAILTERWNAGVSAGRIAAEFGHGLGKNHILGKVHRLGLPRRATLDAMQEPERGPVPGRKKPPVNSTAFGRPGESLPPKPTRHDVFADRPGSVSLMDLTPRSCRWPLDAAHGEVRYCGCRSLLKRPYCAPHEALSESKEARRLRAEAVAA